jgi:hypothetical protein
LHRLGVLLGAVVAAGDRFDHAKLLGPGDAARAAQGLVGARRRLGVAGARCRGQAHALDEIRLVGVARAGRLGVAHLGERFAVAAALDHVLRRLQGLADLRAQAFLRAGGAADASAATTSAAATPARSALLDELFIADHSELGDAEALRRREHGRHRLVFDQLVGPDVHLGLIRLGGGARQRASSAPRSGTASPFHSTVPSKSMSIVTTTGSFSGGGGVPTGMLRLTLCSCTGIVMISMMIRTSITSISGVVLMSIMTSGSPLVLLTLIAMVVPQPFGGGSVTKLTFWIAARVHWKRTRPTDS